MKMYKREREAVAARSAERTHYCNLVRVLDDLDSLCYYLSDCEEEWLNDIARQTFAFGQGWKQFRKVVTELLKSWRESVERRTKDGR